jgi:hypothetical protein
LRANNLLPSGHPRLSAKLYLTAVPPASLTCLCSGHPTPMQTELWAQNESTLRSLR